LMKKMKKRTMNNASTIPSEIAPGGGGHIGFSNGETDKHQVMLVGGVVLKMGC